MSIQLAAIVPHPPIILPQIGQGQEREIRATTAAYREIARRVRLLQPDTLVIVSSHATSYMDYFHISPGKSARGDMGRFGAEQLQVSVRYDEEFSLALEKNAKRAGLSAGTKGERDKALDHGTMIPLLFLAERDLPCEVVRVGISGMDAAEHYRLGKCIKKTAEDLNRDVIVIASGDLSHKLLESGPYGFHASGPVFDQLATEAMAGAIINDDDAGFHAL
jgi:aromatic ring-opening dioxygenase LigB subunit